jgi:membrane dipeptidase
VGYPSKYELLGLKKFGFEVVEVLNESNIIIDVSHLSKKGVIDTVRKSKKPIVASHSNSRVICNNVRNLDDESIKLIADSGGVIGLNVYPPFLYEKCEDGYLSLLKHVKHIIKVGGIECLSIGSDFDGIDKVCNINNPKKLAMIDKFFKTSNLTSSIIDKILYKNALRVFKEYS